MYNQMTICSCRFKRTQTSQWEQGIMINSDVLILDVTGKPVEDKVWTYHLQMEMLALTIGFDPYPIATA